MENISNKELDLLYIYDSRNPRTQVEFVFKPEIKYYGFTFQNKGNKLWQDLTTFILEFGHKFDKPRNNKPFEWKIIGNMIMIKFH
jgi:hypothetical protein